MSTSNDELLEYTLRVAYIHGELEHQQHHSHAARADSSSFLLPPSSRRTSETSSSSSFFAFDFGSLVNRDTSKSPKFPEKLLKTVDFTLQRIAMGQEAKYSNPSFRRSVALFWSSTWPEKSFQRQLKESRKIEDLILAFVTAATKSLKKEDALGDSWRIELSRQVSLFVDLLSGCISAMGPVSSELKARLESYQGYLKVQDTPDAEDKDLGSSLKSSNSMRSLGTKEENAPRKKSMDLLEVVAQLFGLPTEVCRQKVEDMKETCTRQAVLDDLKICLKRLNTEDPYPYKPHDFDHDTTSWASWKADELSSLSQTMLQMMQLDPTLVQSSSRLSQSNSLHTSSSDNVTYPFTFIPSNPRQRYYQLLGKCLDHDLEVLKTLPEDQDVPLSILSDGHALLLSECAARWRLPSFFRSRVFLEAIVRRFSEGSVPSACVQEALSMMDKVQTDQHPSTWPVSERRALESVTAQRDESFLVAIRNALDGPQGYLSEEFLEAVEDWSVLNTRFTNTQNIRLLLRGLEDAIQSAAFTLYVNEATNSLELQEAKSIAFLMHMVSWIDKGIKTLRRRFKGPIGQDIPITKFVLQRQLDLWLRDLEDVLQASELNGEFLDDQFELYHKARKLGEMCNFFSGNKKDSYGIIIASMFDQVVRQWIDHTATKTAQWSTQALAVDNFEPSTPNGPSSSVTDLFASLTSAAQFLMDLEWPDEPQLAVYVNKLAKIIGATVNDYCSKLEELFLGDMRQSETSQTMAKKKAWLEKAKETVATLQGERKLQAFFNFTPESCVKLNNIQAARQQLDKLYSLLRVDDLSAYDTSAPQSDNQQRNFLFTVKVVLAEGLAREGSSSQPDAFVTVSDEHGTRHAKTRTVYDDSNPRWDESFDIPVQHRSWFMVTVRHRNMVGKHDLLGRAYLQLDPSQFSGVMARDALLTLDPKGHILLKVGMEGEEDDMQFHFGRAFRCLKRTESDMIHTLVDKMNPVLRHTLSRSAIKSVLKGHTNYPPVYNEALGKLSAVYKSAMRTQEFIIPPTKEERHRGPTDSEIETAIHPLFDYLDVNNHTLASTLSSDEMELVMAKLWKQILVTIEGLIVPPLSDKRSHMRPLEDVELDIALSWLRFLKDFLYAGGDSSGVSSTILQNQRYHDLLSTRLYYDLSTDKLMEECVRGFQSTLKYRVTKPSKSLRAQRNLGTIRARKDAKQARVNTSGNTEMIMRILRMRDGTQEFLAQQLQTISMASTSKAKRGTL
ncbi:cytoplasmic protein [Cryptococcus neoformans Tu401-1]|nr:cytoplasmic protein [Cryptococcus neoformans var. grubii Bt85]OXG18617.1 cytoplasmic protein [Cryptococcus neoformans var. grubii Tu401-1]OXM79200.1 cytoplasmic protein [Cryptococcus neoformans var. grubii Bt63]